MLELNSKSKITQIEGHQEKHLQKMERNIVKLYLVQMTSSIHFFGSVMIPFFEDWGGVSFTQIMVLEAIFTGGIFLFEVPTGTIADKFSRKLSLILSYLVNTVAVLVYISYANFYAFALGEIIWAAAVALNSGAFDAMVYDTLVELKQESRSKKIISRMQTLGLSTMIAGSISGGLIAKYLGLRATMIFSAIPLFVAFGLSLTLEEPKTHGESEKDNAWIIFRKGCANIRKNQSLQRLIADTVVISVIAYYILWSWQKRMITLNLDLKWFGFIHSGMILAQIIFLSGFQPLERMIEKRGWNRAKLSIIRGTAIGTGIGFILLGASNNVWITIIGALLGAGFGLSRRTILNNYMQKHIASDQRATTISTVSMLRMVILLILNPLMGMMMDSNMQISLVSLGFLAIVWGIFSKVSETDLLD